MSHAEYREHEAKISSKRIVNPDQMLYRHGTISFLVRDRHSSEHITTRTHETHIGKKYLTTTPGAIDGSYVRLDEADSYLSLGSQD